MRIITGSLKGRRLSAPKHTDVRPTTSRVKESFFSSIESYWYIQQSIVLDLFAGSGSLGFEALSRGAKQVIFVDRNQRCLDYIDKMANQFDITDQVRTVCLDALEFLSGVPIPCDIIFADPPYKYKETETIPARIFEQGWLAQEGSLVFEHSKYYRFSEHPQFLREKKFGRTYISFFESQQ